MPDDEIAHRADGTSGRWIVPGWTAEPRRCPSIELSLPPTRCLLTSRSAAFFDLDKTVLSRSSTLALSRTLYKEGFISRAMLARGFAAQMVFLAKGADEAQMDKMRESALELTRGWDRAKILDIVREVMDEVLTPHAYAEAIDLIRMHQAQGRRVYIVSSSPEEVVFPLGSALGVDGVIATEAEIDADGLYTGRLGFYCYGPAKADAIREEAGRRGLSLEESYAYSDSVTDSWMLWTVGHPHAVNPDRDLRRVAAACGWPVLEFRRPVTLRTRLTKAAPRSPAAYGAVGAAAAAGAVLAWTFARPSRRRRLAGIP
ncbi:MAG TPA: HAD-IB family hydrolase [Actinomycetota bacterium]|nr:HAD-IB family hydrolase [Actinomycetota bacterium]